MTVDAMISHTLAGILRSGRPDFNTRFNEARQRFPGLDGNAFTSLLQELVDPVVVAVAAIRPECAAETASAAYDVVLELAGQNLVGPVARSAAISSGWLRVLPAAAGHLAKSPRTVLPAISNALHNLSRTAGASPEEWGDGMVRLANESASAAEFLKVGQILAWRCGMAHYRAAALKLLGELPEQLALNCLTLPLLEGGGTDTHSKKIDEILQLLQQDLWYDPAEPDSSRQSGLRLVRSCGAFRGFGGLFVEPPKVAVHDGAILVRSSGECWLLTADRFGATFHHCDQELFNVALKQPQLTGQITISGSRITYGNSVLALEHLGEISSAALVGDTLALTSSLTHGVTLVALR